MPQYRGASQRVRICAKRDSGTRDEGKEPRHAAATARPGAVSQKRQLGQRQERQLAVFWSSTVCPSARLSITNSRLSTLGTLSLCSASCSLQGAGVGGTAQGEELNRPCMRREMHQ